MKTKENRVKIVYFDIADEGAEILDQFFKEEETELVEILKVGRDQDINIQDLAYYDGWDYLVVTSFVNRDEMIDLFSRIGIESERIIFLSTSELYCNNEERIERIFRDDYLDRVSFGRMINKYENHISGDYSVVTAEECSYIHNSRERLIMGHMYYSGMNWAHDDMWKFYRLANKYYEFTNEQNIFCDIGANIGTTSIYFKKKIDPDIKILAFEPSKENYKMLKINMLLNDIDEKDQILVNMGVSDHEEKASFAYDSFNSGGSKIVKGGESKEEVELTAFDSYIRKILIDAESIKYIWVDVEGFEPYFVNGAGETLRSINVPIVIEFSPDKYIAEGCYREYVDQLCDIYDGFIYMQDDDEKIHKIEELYSFEGQKELPLLDLFLLKKKG